MSEHGRAGNSLPLVSVIVPVYNGREFIHDTLDSILAQTYRPIEVIVVDDGSTDESAGIIRSFEDVIYLRQANQGPAAARNAGIEAAHGEFLAFCDADDLWRPDKLTRQIAYMLSNPELGYTISMMRYMTSPGFPTPRSVRADMLDKDCAAYVPSALVARKTALAKVGAFDLKYSRGEDSDWFFRARDMRIPMAVVHEVLLDKRIHDLNLSNETASVQNELLRVVRASISRKNGPKE